MKSYIKSTAKKVSAKVVKAATVRQSTDDQEFIIPDAIIRDGVRFEQAPVASFAEKAQFVQFLVPAAVSFLTQLASMSHQAEKDRLETLAKVPEALKASFEQETKNEALATRAALIGGRTFSKMYLGTVNAISTTLGKVVDKVDFAGVMAVVAASNARIQDRNDRELALRERESEARMAIEKLKAEVEAEKQRARNAEDAKEAALRLEREQFRLVQEVARAKAEADANAEMEKVRKARQDAKLGMS